MTVDAQSALRRTIEVHSKQTRFCIICNYVSKIIEPLASRCVKFRFCPISDEAQKERLEFISAKEGLRLGPGAVQELINITDGDLRKSIMMLQTSSRFCEGNLTKTDIQKVSGLIPKEVIE